MKIFAIKLIAALAAVSVLPGCQSNMESTGLTNGRLLMTDREQLTIRDSTEGEVQTFEVAPHADITLNGNAAGLAELRSANQRQPVYVLLTHQGPSQTVTDVSATTKLVSRKPPPSVKTEAAKGERRNRRPSKNQLTDNNVKTKIDPFEGEILSFNERWFFLRIDEEKRFVKIPENINVVDLDDRRSQIGQIANVIADKINGEYVARGIIVRPPNPSN